MKYIEVIILTILSIIATILIVATFASCWMYDWVRFLGIWGGFSTAGILLTLWLTGK